jgi:hypothetical protein
MHEVRPRNPIGLAVGLSRTRSADQLRTYSVFTISMAALAGMMEPCLFGIIPQEAIHSLDVAISVFDAVAEVSPSLDEMGAILRERIHLYRCN